MENNKPTFENPDIGIILLLGGKGLRFGSPLPKQFHSLGDVTVFEKTAISIARLKPRHIVFVVHSEYIKKPFFLGAMDRLRKEIECEVSYTIGGETRHLSFRNGLIKLREIDRSINKVAVHDANRPFLGKDFLDRISKKLECLKPGLEAYIPVLPMTDSVVQNSSEGNKEVVYVDRSELFTVQTPQLIYAPSFYDHISLLKRDNYTDEGSAAQEMGLNVFLFPGDLKNKKITYSRDLE